MACDLGHHAVGILDADTSVAGRYNVSIVYVTVSFNQVVFDDAGCYLAVPPGRKNFINRVLALSKHTDLGCS